MVDKKISDIKYRHGVARDIANKLDVKDEAGKDGLIIANVWNDFVSDKNGRRINRVIGVNNAVKSISTYLYREALQSNELITDIGDKWESAIDNPEAEKAAGDKKSAKGKTAAKETAAEKTDKTSTKKTKKETDKTVKTDKTTKTNKSKVTAKESKKDTAIAEPTDVDASKIKDDIYATDNRYSKMTKRKANELVQKDPRLEKLNGGAGWSVKNETFRTDVTYARKNTGKILSYIASITGADLVVTSALGTGQRGNPHQKSGYASHHNAENPKLDLKANNCTLRQLELRLKNTGFFSRVSRERHHIDVQIKPEVYLAFEQNLSGPEVTKLIKNQGKGKKKNQFLA